MILSCDVQGWTSVATYKDVLVQRCHGWQGAAGATDGKELPHRSRCITLRVPPVFAIAHQ